MASEMIYSIAEIVRRNNLNIYCYIKHLLKELLELIEEMEMYGSLLFKKVCFD